MNRLFKLMAFAAILFSVSATLQSCDLDNDDNKLIIDPVERPNALVTFKTDSTTGAFFMQLNDSVTLVDKNITKSPYGDKEVRGLISFVPVDKNETGLRRQIHLIMVFDSIRIKPMSPVVPDLQKAYGNDPVEIVNDWTTVCEDGYLTLRFRTYFGGVKPHMLRLVRTGDYEVTLYHDAGNDVRGRLYDGWIAFRLNDLPDTGGNYKDLTLKWTSFSGEKSVTFKYKTRK